MALIRKEGGNAMSPTLLEGLLFLLLAALLAAYIGTLVFTWWPQRRGAPPAPGPKQAGAPGAANEAAEGEEPYVR